MEHDSRFDELDALDDYKLEHHSQDIRGRPLVTPLGKKLGVIKDMLVDKKKERVVAIRLDDGRACAVEPLEIHDDKVVYDEAIVTRHRTEAEAGRTGV